MSDSFVKSVNGKQGFVKLTTDDIPETDQHLYTSIEEKSTLNKLLLETRGLREHTFDDSLHVSKEILNQINFNMVHRDNQIIHLSPSMREQLENHLDSPHKTGRRGLRGFPGPPGSAAGPDITFLDNRYVNITGDTMTGNLDMGGNNITGIADMVIADGGSISVSGGMSLTFDNTTPQFQFVDGNILFDNTTSTRATMTWDASANNSGTLAWLSTAQRFELSARIEINGVVNAQGINTSGNSNLGNNLADTNIFIGSNIFDGVDVRINADSLKLLWGAGQDASIYFDGGNFIINSEVLSNEVRVTNYFGLEVVDGWLSADEIRGSLGTIIAPSHTFEGDFNTGMWSSGPDLINFSTGGVERLEIGTEAVFTVPVSIVDNLLSLGDGTVNDVVMQWISDCGTGTITWSDTDERWETSRGWTVLGTLRCNDLRNSGDSFLGNASGDAHIIHGITKIGDDGSTTFLQISAVADTYWVGSGTGLLCGSFWGNEIGFVAAGGGGTYFEISDADITVGQTNLTTFQNNKELAVSIAGVYKVDWSMSVKASGANKHIVGGIGVDVGGAGALVIQNDGRNHAVSTGNAEFAVSGAALLDLPASSEVGLMATNETDNTNVTVEHVSLSMIQVGGT